MESTKYINHQVILTSLERVFKEKQFNEEDILNWCQEVETLYVADPSGMVFYSEIPLAVVSGTAQLPSNIYKIRDVYADPKVQVRTEYSHVSSYIKMPNYTEDIIFINYVGTPMDENCFPLIHKDHQSACEAFCKINSFEEDALLGLIDKSLFFDWKQRFDGMIQGVKGGFRDWDNLRYEKMNIIMGSQIPRIGFVPLANKQFAGATTNQRLRDGAIVPDSSFYTKY